MKCIFNFGGKKALFMAVGLLCVLAARAGAYAAGVSRTRRGRAGRA
jgi:hypothetical protein